MYNYSTRKWHVFITVDGMMMMMMGSRHSDLRMTLVSVIGYLVDDYCVAWFSGCEIPHMYPFSISGIS